jgi:hypothetical protein
MKEGVGLLANEAMAKAWPCIEMPGAIYHYSCVLFELLNRWATMIREIMDGWRIG